MGTPPVKEKKGSWAGQREKQGSEAVTAEASVDFMARSEARTGWPCSTVPSRPGGQAFVPTVTRHWMQAAQGQASSWAVQLPLAEGSSWKRLRVTVSSQHPCSWESKCLSLAGGSVWHILHLLHQILSVPPCTDE